MSSPSSISYWCYSCSRFVSVWEQTPLTCPDCDGGFLEEVAAPPAASRRRILAGNADPRRLRRRPAAAADRSPFNPVIVLRGPPAANGFELFYDDGSGSGLRPLPATMSDFLMGSGFDRLLDQLAQIEITGAARHCDHPPASKSAVDSMPTVQIADRHVSTDAHCAVCKDQFELGDDAREMPCNHIYHQDCILPWLAIRNSCPVCRHEMPTDSHAEENLAVEDDAVGLTIWRLPGGGFAVGRFSGARRAGEREVPVVYTEMDGGFNAGGTPRRVSWASRGSRERESRGIGRVFRSFLSLFRRRPSSASPRSGAGSVVTSFQSSRSNGGVGRGPSMRIVNAAAPVWH